jgi:hypothetical protein
MKKAFISYFLSFSLVVLLPFAAMFLLPLDDSRFLGLPVATGLVILVGYFFLAVFLFLFLQDVFFTFPAAQVSPKGITDIQTELTNYFNQANQKANYFQLANTPTETAITWHRDIKYNQLIDIGGASSKKLYILSFDSNRHQIFLTLREKDFDYSVSPTSLGASMRFNYGFSFEDSIEYHPSLVVKNGSYKLDLQKVTFSTNDILAPVMRIARDGGWAVRITLFRSPMVQNIFLVLAILTFLFAGLVNIAARGMV